MLANQQSNYSPISITSTGKAVKLGVVDFLDNYIIPITLDNSIESMSRCYITMTSNVMLESGGFQNIDATSTVAIYYMVTYIIPSGELQGKWIIYGRQDYIPPVGTPPSPFYDGLDPALQYAPVLTPNSGDNFFLIENFDLKNRRCFREELYTGETLEDGVLTVEDDYLIIEDSSNLLFHTGYFVVKPYYNSFDSRVSLGVGVTDTEVDDLFAMMTFNINYLPSLRS